MRYIEELRTTGNPTVWQRTYHRYLAKYADVCPIRIGCWMDEYHRRPLPDRYKNHRRK